MKTIFEIVGDKLAQHDSFDSIQQLAEYAHGARNSRASGAEDSSATGSKSFNGGLSFTQAVDIARAGGNWQEGIADMQKMALGADKKTPQPRTVFKSSVQGSRVSVPRFLAGNPRNMVRATRATAPKKVLKIGVVVSSSSDTPTAYIKNRGVAILSAINELENSGYSIELYATFSTVTTRASAKHKRKQYHHLTYTANVRIKAARDRLTIADIAYPLAHASFSRRLAFAALERSELADITTAGYGRVLNDNLRDYDVFLKGLGSDTEDLDFSSPRAAHDTILSDIAEQVR